MHSERCEENDDEPLRSRSGSRRNSGSASRRNSLKRDTDAKKTKSPLNTTPNSASSTPKKIQKTPNLDFIVTGKQILKRYDRANSLPGTYHRRPSAESIASKGKKGFETTRKTANTPQSVKSRDTSLEEDVSLDLSQVSDFEDNNSKYGQKFKALATSTPKTRQQQRSGSAMSHLSKVEKRGDKSTESRQSRESTFSYSRDSLYRTSSSASPYRYGVSTDLDYSSVSPEYSGQSSAELSPRARVARDITNDDQNISSCCLSTWQDCSQQEKTKVEGFQSTENGEWNDFWANYNNSIAKVPVKKYYDQCPTPYRTENIDLADFDFSPETSLKRTPENIKNLNTIIRSEGLHLTPRETQNMIKCAHILGNVLTKAIERRSMEKEKQAEIHEVGEEVELKKRTMTLNLNETNAPAITQEEKSKETVTTQTDISLPNTKSAPRIFENILRQLSRSSIDESLLPPKPDDVNKDKNDDIK